MRVILLPNMLKPEAVKCACEFGGLITNAGHRCFCLEEAYEVLQDRVYGLAAVTEDMKRQKSDLLAITFGGDGTMLRAMRNLDWPRFPFWGINYGHVGYLTDVERFYAVRFLDKVLENKYPSEKRMLLSGYVRTRSGRRNFMGLNEAALSRGGLTRGIHMKITIDRNLLQEYTADGVLVSTSTGSTAYNYSAGGPLLMPTSKHLVMTALAPQGLAVKSIVVSGDSDIGVRVTYQQEGDAKPQLVIDGCEVFSLEPGAEIHLYGSKQFVNIIRTGGESFCEILSRRLVLAETHR